MRIPLGDAGGEKRRLSIACALIAQPSLLFLDEPTTGLDSFAALNIMEHMSCLAGMGHTIVASIHQPRTAIWDMFHKVGSCRLVLSRIANQRHRLWHCLIHGSVSLAVVRQEVQSKVSH